MAARIFSRKASASWAIGASAAGRGARVVWAKVARGAAANTTSRAARRETSIVLSGQGGEDTRPAARALVEAGEIILLVRRMHPVVVEGKADQEGVEAERALEVADDRDGTARADGHGLAAPLVRQGRLRFFQGRHVVGHRERPRALVLDELHRAVGRDTLAHESLEGVADLLRVLVADKAE